MQKACSEPGRGWYWRMRARAESEVLKEGLISAWAVSSSGPRTPDVGTRTCEFAWEELSSVGIGM